MQPKAASADPWKTPRSAQATEKITRTSQSEKKGKTLPLTTPLIYFSSSSGEFLSRSNLSSSLLVAEAALIPLCRLPFFCRVFAGGGRGSSSTVSSFFPLLCLSHSFFTKKNLQHLIFHFHFHQPELMHELFLFQLNPHLFHVPFLQVFFSAVFSHFHDSFVFWSAFT